MATIVTNISQAVLALKAGELVGFPTETVYGLGADANNIDAVKSVYAAKNRPDINPLIVHISDIGKITEWATDIPDYAWRLAKENWPGPLTLVLPKKSTVNDIVTAGQDTIALRVPQHPMALALLREFGGGLVGPSANRSGRISPTSALAVQQELANKITYIIDGGECRVGIESTILLCTKDKPVILRQGMLMPDIEFDLTIQNKPMSPGSQLSHYAPEKELYLISKNKLAEFINKQNKSMALLSFKQPEKKVACWLDASDDPKIYAKNLYKNLRELDATSCEILIVEQVPELENWRAIADKLFRAKSHIL